MRTDGTISPKLTKSFAEACIEAGASIDPIGRRSRCRLTRTNSRVNVAKRLTRGRRRVANRLFKLWPDWPCLADTFEALKAEPFLWNR